MRTKKNNCVNNFDEAAEAAEAAFAKKKEEQNGEKTNLPKEGETAEKTDRPEAKNADNGEKQPTADEQLRMLAEELARMQAENSGLREQAAQMAELIDRMNSENRERLTDTTMPYKTERERFRESSDGERDRFNDAVSYITESVLKKIEPQLEYAKRGREEAEKNEVIKALSGIPELKGIEGMAEQLDRIIENNSALRNKNVPLDEKYITAYAVAKGVEAMNNPKKAPTVDELMIMYNKNGEFRNAVEKQRLNEIKNNADGVPALSGSSGNGNIALDVPDKPKNFAEASDLVRKLFGSR